MADLLERLEAALNETERIARAAAGMDEAFPTPEWSFKDGDDYVYALDRRGPRDIDVIHDQIVTGASYGGPSLDNAPGRHIAHHDPARVLRQVAAHREILAFYQRALTYQDTHRSAAANGEVQGLYAAIRLVAEGYRIEVER